ncbi:BCCT family transporter [Halopiger xanaduensis]|uniref:Choline/carnitine/betaine transporter n=1 Tax=Halopiger xanaduensis (strain DSM 18323 / JCM 14033 / SH-6) TaxID=797210 RepID=F8DCI7_HALXS|nr:BCCT family transporter [Halopiger xanaduensis]AEH36029.1 choline/carnitine/betaine transporter [Halopiger xanaduensis SH-6]
MSTADRDGASDDDGALRTFVAELDPVVFGVGFVVAASIVVAFLLREERTLELMEGTNEFLWTSFGWAYLVSMFALVAFVLFLIFGPWGNIKLGDPDEDPEFSFLAYFAMLYSAGIAAGIVFWGPAEAIFHYSTPSPFSGVEAETTGAAVSALQYTFFHWGLSAWSAYVIIGIPIAYFAYRKGAPMRISTIIAPIVGLDNLEGPWAKLVDILAVFATIGGIATTLGLVGNQFLVGLEYAGGVSFGDAGTVLVITGLTVAFTISVALGVEKGIRRVSYFNMGLFGLLTVAAFVLGPSVYIMTVGTQALGAYINEFVSMSLFMGASETGGQGADSGFVGAWTVFYWAWWFSWAPFVGLFIARISRGRTVRQVAATGVVASTAVTIPWFATMGGTSIFLESSGQAEILGTLEAWGFNEAVAGYPLFEALPAGELLTVLFLVLVTTFFVTSADSSTLALGMLTTGGKRKPSTINRVIWGALMGALASLLMVAGGTTALQQAAIIAGGPFAVITLVAVGVMISVFGSRRALFLREEDRSEAPTGQAMPEDD